MNTEIWLGLGLIAGGVVSLMYDESFPATIRNIVFGIAGSIIGGGLITTWDAGRLPTLDFYFYSTLFTLFVSLALITGARLRSIIASQNFTPMDVDETEEKKEDKLYQSQPFLPESNIT